MTTNREYNQDAEDLQAVHELLGVQDAEKGAGALAAERYAALEHRDPDPRLDIDYILISRSLEWGAQAALAGVIGNAIYDGVKSALLGLVRRRRQNEKAGLDSNEAGAFARYVLAYLVVYKRNQVLYMTDDHPPPELTATEKEGRHWVCRFEKRRLTHLRKNKLSGRDRMLDAIWIESIELRVDANNPSIPEAHYRKGTELRETDSEEAHRVMKDFGSVAGDGIEQHGLGKHQETEWKRVGDPLPPPVINGGVCGV